MARSEDNTRLPPSRDDMTASSLFAVDLCVSVYHGYDSTRKCCGCFGVSSQGNPDRSRTTKLTVLETNISEERTSSDVAKIPLPIYYLYFNEL
jgi:hypothetical protein